VRVVARESAEAHQVDEALRVAGRLVAVDLQGQADVVDDAAPGEQGRVLEDEADLLLTLGLARGFAVDEDAAAGGRLQAADQTQESRFAAAAGADDRDELAALEGEIDVTQSREVTLGGLVDRVYAFDNDMWLVAHPRPAVYLACVRRMGPVPGRRLVYSRAAS
jgi:hypothetical protein